MKSIESITKEYPLHYLVWNNDYENLAKELKTGKHDKEKLDPRGRTPLMLAVKLSHAQSVKCLLSAKCNANFECDGWSTVQEAVCAGDENILTMVLEVRDLQRHIQRVTHVPQLLQHLLDAPDFYVEMKWEFTSWVPLMSRLCPSDTYKVYKRGANVRIDTTLLGFDNATWQRGNRSYIFKGLKDSATMIEIDHDTHEVLVEQLQSVVGEVEGIPIPVGSARARLSAPVMSNNIDMDKISFERNKSGIWGWRRNDKCEAVNGYNCKVYGASNVEFITRTRTEHLNEDQMRAKNSRSPLHNILGFTEEELAANPELANNRETVSTPNSDDKSDNEVTNDDSGSSSSGNTTPKSLIPEEYFSDADLNGRDVGRPKKINTKVQRFKATVWLSEDFPIKLQEQVLPILDLMSTMASPHVSKLKDFITMQLPSGFPVKVEIPLFHVLNACVTFGNVFGTVSPVDMVQTIEENERLTCVIDDQCFEIPSHYVNRDHDLRRQFTLEDEDDLLQLAIEQSLNESSASDIDKVDIWEALKGSSGQKDSTANSPNRNFLSEEDAQLQRALQKSLSQFKNMGSDGNSLLQTQNQPQSPVNSLISPGSDFNRLNYCDPDLAMALRISEQEQKEYELQLQQEQEMMERILKLSLEEK
ncbi:ankyrin repeat domain-containing protein 13D [Condylostylus longicornis]|uniref:ankyrin repeat domain-containing protein 13D n=1 Tax=Condylostylus longicornis TaxID=2530218 RepID=UPI00244E58A2|nr:ankyrin repeat domain-containing protein 13D [Condylostylus longicornis]